jgi:hypothetical protein
MVPKSLKINTKSIEKIYRGITEKVGPKGVKIDPPMKENRAKMSET